MKKVIFGFLVLSVVVISSCKKGVSNSWSFKGTTYGQTACVGSGGQLTAASANPSSTLTANFYNGLLPTTGGTYTAVANPTTASQVALEILVTSNGDDYISTRGTVNLTVSGGKVSLSGSNINMTNTGGIDTTSLNVNIAQTQ